MADEAVEVQEEAPEVTEEAAEVTEEAVMVMTVKKKKMMAKNAIYASRGLTPNLCCLSI